MNLDIFLMQEIATKLAVPHSMSNAARLMRADDWGVLKPGKKADLIVTDGRPDRNISETRNIEMVMQAGKNSRP